MIKSKIAWLIENREGGNKTRFARKIGVKDGRSALVHDWLNGRSKPKSEYQRAICKIYGVSIEWLNDDNISCDCKISAGDKITVTGTIDAEKLAATITGLVESTKTIAESNRTLADSTKTIAESNKTLADSNKIMAESNRTLADTNAKLGSHIKKRDTNQ